MEEDQSQRLEAEESSAFQFSTLTSQGSLFLPESTETDPWREEKLSPLDKPLQTLPDTTETPRSSTNAILTQDMLLKSLNENERSFLETLSQQPSVHFLDSSVVSQSSAVVRYDDANEFPDDFASNEELGFKLADAFTPLPANNVVSPPVTAVKQDFAYGDQETPETETSVSAAKSHNTTPDLQYVKGSTKSEAISNMQGVFTDSQKVAYVGLCYLHIDQWRKTRFTHATKKVTLAYDAWSTHVMEKLYIYLDLLPEERSMIRSLAEHGLLPSDLTSGILKDVNDAKSKLEKQHEKNLDPESEMVSPVTPSTSPSDIRYTILSHLFVLSIADGFYDAWSRTLLRAIANDFEVELHDFVRLEKVIADQLRVNDGSDMVKPDQELIGNRNKIEGQNRWLLAGLATVAGGTIIGLTAGLAAPLIGAGIGAALSTFGVTGTAGVAVGSFMASTGGLAIITTGGVLTGGGMSGFKMMKRTRGIEEFEFLGLQEALKIIEENRQKRQDERRKRRKRLAKLERDEKASRDGSNTLPSSSMSHSLSSTALDSADPAKSAHVDLVWDISSPMPKEGDESHPNLASLGMKNRSTTSLSTVNVATPKSGYLKSPIDAPESNESENVSGMLSGKSRETNVLITIAGWLAHGKDDYTFPFSTLTPGLNGDQYSLLWESQVLTELGSSLGIIVGEIASFIFQQGLQATLLPMLMAGLTGPMWMIKLTYLVDNPWGNALTKAEKAGRVLADTLIGQVQSNRPVTLVGFSLGARLIYFCLAELAARNASGLVEEVYMFGTPVMSSQKEWRKIASVVSNRIVNGYTASDTMLGVLYRASSALWNDVAGLRPVDDVPGIENMDLTDLVAGHLEYRTKMPKILERCGFAIDSDTFEDLDAEEEKAKQELELEKKMEKEALEREKLAEKKKKQDESLRKKKAKEEEAVRKKAEKEASNNSHSTSGRATPTSTYVTTDDLVQDELEQMSQLEEMMQSYWQPREIKSTLPPLVIDVPIRKVESSGDKADHVRNVSHTTTFSEMDRIDNELSAEMNEMGQFDVDTPDVPVDSTSAFGFGRPSKSANDTTEQSQQNMPTEIRPPQASFSGGLSLPPRAFSGSRR